MDERVFFHLSEVLPDDANAPSASSADSAPEAESAAATVPANSSGGGKPVIRRGQEVAFRIGQRQGKPLGLRVRKLKSGTLPTEESLPGRFVGVVVVPPRSVGTDKDKEKVSVPSSHRLHCGCSSSSFVVVRGKCVGCFETTVWAGIAFALGGVKAACYVPTIWRVVVG